jgi:hypothetical protein
MVGSVGGNSGKNTVVRLIQSQIWDHVWSTFSACKALITSYLFHYVVQRQKLSNVRGVLYSSSTPVNVRDAETAFAEKN